MRYLKPGSTFLDRYRILSRLGSGVSSVVYEAIDDDDDARVVIKHFESTEAPADREVGYYRLLYPELFLDSGVDDQGHPYIVTKLLPGKSADKLTLTSADAVETVMADVLVELARLHERGVLHGDVKPANILVSNDKSRLLDFGIASKMLTPSQRQEFDAAKRAYKLREATTGTPEEQLEHWRQVTRTYLAWKRQLGGFGDDKYGPPEQVGDEYESCPVDERADLYSLGATVYAMLEGAPPRKCGNQQYALVPVVPPYLAAALDRALACDPDERYPSALAMLADLRPDLRAAAEA